MSLKARKEKFYTPEEYLALEEKAEYRSEYNNGVIVAMAGGSLNHQQIIANFTEFLGAKIRRNGCRVLPTEMKVQVEAVNKFYYPDVTVICEKPEFFNERDDTITNPKLLIEVLSNSTEAKDRGEKFFAYQTLESFQEYVLVSQDKHLVETFTEQTDGSWRYLATIGLESKVYLESVKAEISMQEIYDLVEFERENLL
jgi:Uma2 family endonuclease